jgi:hypothetical protein
MTQWSTLTPDGRTLCVRREKGTWIAKCGDADEVQDELLDFALIEAIREDATVVGHSPQPAYGAWVRARADQIERDLGAG